MPKPTLLPCPFCGGVASVRVPDPDWDGYATHVACGCGAQLFGKSRHFLSADAAACSWNHRPAPTGAQAPVAWLANDGAGRVIDAKAKAAGERAAATGSATAVYSIPLYTAPPAASEDAADAARYRWLRSDAAQIDALLAELSNGDGFKLRSGADLDAAVDAARDGEGV